MSAAYETVYVAPLKNVEVSLKCRACGQTMKAMLDMPESFHADEITLNLAWCPFDTEEGRTDLMKGVSLHYEREARSLKREHKN